MKLKYMNIAVDFDGTIVNKDFPRIGELKPHCKEVLAKVKELGGRIIIWSCRTGEYLEQAIEFMNHSEIPYDLINATLPENIKLFGEEGRKVWADIYIDDSDIHVKEKGIDWYIIEGLLFEGDLNA